MSKKAAPLSGFGNYFSSEAISGALPSGQNSPQQPPFGLYAEQLSGSSFTRKRAHNLRTWMYRLYPSVVHSAFRAKLQSNWMSAPLAPGYSDFNQIRWDPVALPLKPTTFLDGMVTFLANGSPITQDGSAIHLFVANQSLGSQFLVNADAEMLLLPQQGPLEVLTELGRLFVRPGEIVVIPRGMRCQINPTEGAVRGYLLENYGKPFVLPELGPIGSNGLAQPRDFIAPHAQFEDKAGAFSLVVKYQGAFWEANLNHYPLDVVAWHGNLVPYKYDLALFNTINTVSVDHPDPSIFTVLTSPSDTEGVANVDFVIFPPRWMVAEHSFRPPYYHRNIMSEYMGLIHGQYDAKPEGFVPGGGSLHTSMTAHGPDSDTWNAATQSSLAPHKIDNTLAFMFESRHPWLLTEFAYQGNLRQRDYQTCWQKLTKHFVAP